MTHEPKIDDPDDLGGPLPGQVLCDDPTLPKGWKPSPGTEVKAVKLVVIRRKENGAYWRAPGLGSTPELERAHVYTEAEAIKWLDNLLKDWQATIELVPYNFGEVQS